MTSSPPARLSPLWAAPWISPAPKKLGDDMFAEDHLIQLNGGFDHNFCVEGEASASMPRPTSPKAAA